MNLLSRAGCLSVLVNTIQGYGQEGVSYKPGRVDGLNIFYRESGADQRPGYSSAPWRSNLFSHVSTHAKLT